MKKSSATSGPSSQSRFLGSVGTMGDAQGCITTCNPGSDVNNMPSSAKEPVHELRSMPDGCAPDPPAATGVEPGKHAAASDGFMKPWSPAQNQNHWPAWMHDEPEINTNIENEPKKMWSDLIQDEEALRTTVPQWFGKKTQQNFLKHTTSYPDFVGTKYPLQMLVGQQRLTIGCVPWASRDQHHVTIWGTYAGACHGPPEHTAAHVLEKTIAFRSTPEHAMALQATPKQMLEHAMALQSTLQHMCWHMPWPSMYFRALQGIPWPSGVSCGICSKMNCGKPATPEQMLEHAIVLWEQIPEHTAAHVPEHTIAFQSTPEQAMALQEHAMALQDKLQHASHSRANSRVNCSTCARAFHGPPEHTAAHVLEHTIAFQSTPEQAMALQNKLQLMFQTKLWHGRHSGANSGANCSSYARAYP
ncbi:hypothetical protein F5J12DRAFT_783509 [Pisolithus orientalis]|uniref:uncharacterized protein n=1 Tax=Pisolithus orientalis TaxID=936130 RepID=UPI00222406E1|nr:uncharacterized protein F5J12DRAFT_783509 [Pisolithus orientalis]KAI6003436.1 hypothetical protein F5J12DRAFT_783509 [Pisolithus orientalis]